MKKIIALLHRRRWQQTLLLYVDGELPQNEMAPIDRHLETCALCRQTQSEILACRALLKNGGKLPFIPAEQMWQRIARKTMAAPSRWQKLGEIFSAPSGQTLRWAVVAGMILLGVIWGVKLKEGAHNIFIDTRAPVAAAAIDYGIFFDDLRRNAPASAFYKRYPAQIVKLTEAQQKIAFPLAAIETLPDSFRLDCVRVLECNGQKCIQFTCSKADKVINIFQHALGQAWTLGSYAVARAPICNVECLLVNASELTAVSWQGKYSEYLAVGDLAPQEFAQVVQMLR